MSMKKSFRMIGLACVAMSVMPLVSCGGDDDGDVTPPNEIETETGMRLTRVGNYEFNYDSKGRCNGVDYLGSSYDDSGNLSINWDKGEISVTDGDDAMYENPLKFKTNSNGYITGLSQSWDYKDEYGSYKGNGEAKLSYDKSGHLTKATFESKETGVDEGEKFSFYGKSVYSFTWQNGNLVRIENSWEDNDDGERETGIESYDISYDNEENAYNQWSQGILYYAIEWDFSQLGHVGMFGVGTANFPTTIEENEDDYSHSYSLSFATNSLGLISSENVNGSTYNYYYDEAGTRAAFDQSLPAKAKKSLFMRHRKAHK